MTDYVALLRAVNVGGRGILKMADLHAICVARGLENVRTQGQSGNVLFESSRSERALKQELERAATDKMGRTVGVLIRTVTELKAAFGANPFRDADPSIVGVIFLPKALPNRLLIELALDGPEEVRMIGRELFVHYPSGMGRSKLKLPFAADGTTRNLNTIAKLLLMAGA